MNRCVGKSFVITGGSSGIGLATAQRIVAEGGRVLVTGSSATKLSEVRTESILTLLHDAADLEAADLLAEETMGTMAEVAAVATFLLSDEASFVTGSDYAVDGGEAQL